MENTAQLELLGLIGDLSNRLSEFKSKHLESDAQINVDISCSDATVHIHSHSDHSTGLKIKRMLGIEDMEKTIHDPEHPWHYLRGTIAKNVEARIYCQGLPPMCKIEEYFEEVPKTQIVDMPETVKVKRTRICCVEGK